MYAQGLLKSETDPQRARVTAAAFEVCRRIEQITPIKSADVLTMVLLGANRKALTAAEIHKQATEIAALVAQRDLPAASGFSLNNEEEVAAAVLAMQASGLVACFDDTAVPVYYIPQEQRLAAAYYRNTITHYFLRAAMSEIALAMCARDIDLPSEKVLRRHVVALRDLYKFEFFYKSTEELCRDVLQETGNRYPGWDSGDHSLQKLLRDKPPRFGHAILRSISEAYLVIAVTLLELEAQPVDNNKAFTKQLLAQGEQMLLRRTISCQSSVSQDLFATGLRLADHLHLLSANGSGLLQAREAFADRVVTALSAINLLQRSYDAAWFSQLTAGKVSNLLGP
jgi:glycerol-3-phosphate O-acyltransferase